MKSGPKPAGDRTSWKSERCDYAPLSNNTYSLSTLTCRPPWGRLRPARPSLRSWPPKRNVFNIPRSARAGKPRFVCQTVIFLSRVSVITGKQSCRFGRFPSTAMCGPHLPSLCSQPSKGEVPNPPPTDLANRPKRMYIRKQAADKIWCLHWIFYSVRYIETWCREWAVPRRRPP